MTTPDSYDILLDSNRGTDFLLSNTRHRVGLRNFCFSIANRNVPFCLEKKMPKGIYKRTEEHIIKLKERLKKQWENPEYRKKIGQSHKGEKFSKEHRRKMGLACKGSKNYFWKGGIIKDKGYITKHKPEHPFTDFRGYVREHRLIMEEFLGRYLTKDECVHHINGIKNDNRIENLQLVSKGIHYGKVNCPFCNKEFVIR